VALLLNEEEVARSLSVAEAVEVLREAFAGPADLLPRWRGRAPEGTVGVYNVMAASLPQLGYMGVKSYAWVKGGSVRFHVLLYAWESGRLEAVLEANGLGCTRTGAASGLATDLLARPDARVLACIGSGVQALAQVAAVAAVRRLSEVRVFSRRPERRAAFAERVRAELGLPAVACESAREAVAGADVVTTITSASQPVLLGEWLQPGVHVNAAGSNVAHHSELDAAAVLRADRIVADARAEAEVESGDLIPLVRDGRLSWDRVADLADVLAGSAPGRTSPSDVTLFESQGLALEDVAAAARAVANARRLGLGREVEIR
jgi:alanine dehydrogenase